VTRVHCERATSDTTAADGSENAARTTTAAVDTMTITQAITHPPDVKPHVDAGRSTTTTTS
jgi:hypothetical protein